MRTLTLKLALAGAALGMACQAPPPAQPAAPEFTAADEATLRAMFDSTIVWIRGGNWAAWAGQYAQDGFFQPPNAPTARGQAAVLAWGQAFPPIDSVAFSDVQVWGEGNIAYGTSAYALKPKGLSLDTGKQLAVFRRSPGGTWQVVAASFNSDLPLAAGVVRSP